jgi:hypothetical protein
VLKDLLYISEEVVFIICNDFVVFRSSNLEVVKT